MRLSSQVKRGYLALMGLAAIGFVALFGPQFGNVHRPLDITALVMNACAENSKTSWRLASTPIDIQPILIRKAMLCQV